MDETAPPPPPQSADEILSEAVAALHLVALDRKYDVLRTVFGNSPPHRAREAFWVAAQVILAHFRGERLALRDLVLRAEGLVSGPTLSRVVAEMEQDDLLVGDTPPGAGRLRPLRPTERTLRVLAGRAQSSFAEFAAIVHQAEQRLAEAQTQAPNSLGPRE